GPLSGCGATNEQPPFSDDRPNSGSLAEVTPPVATVGADPAPPVVVAGIPPADAGLPPAPPVAIPKLPPPLLSPPPMELPPVAAPPVSEPPVPPLPDVPPVPGSSGSFGVNCQKSKLKRVPPPPVKTRKRSCTPSAPST